MQLHWLSYLIEVANAGSISKASRRVFLNQQHLSKIIAAIEKELDTKIFIRTARGSELTETGEKIIDWAREVIRSYETLQESITTTSSTPENFPEHLHIQCSPSNVGSKYLRVMETFAKQWPQIDLIFDENSSENIIENIQKDIIDIGICVLFPDFENYSRTFSTDIVFIPCYKAQAAVFVPPHHHLVATHKQISMKELQKESIIVFKPSATDFPISLKIIDFFSEYSYRIRFTLSNEDVFNQLLNTGEFVHLGSSANHKQFNRKNLVMIPISDSIMLETGIVIKKERINQAYIKAFIDIYLQNFKD